MSENKKIPLNEGYQPTASKEERGYQPVTSAGSQQGQSIPPTGGATIQTPQGSASNKPKE